MEVKYMKYVRPDYYDNFRCIADKCRHSCCTGWEIEIDRASLEFYSELQGDIGEKLRRCISIDPEPHFILDKDERCPLLNERGLCELILALGENSICDICTEHPRFYNEFSGRTEYGVGMCCESAVELLLSGSGHSVFICEDCGEEIEEAEADIFALREKVFAILNSGGSFAKRMSDGLELLGGILPETDIPGWTGLLLSLERLDDAWTVKLEGLNGLDPGIIIEAVDDIRYERIAEYIIFRYFASVDEDKRNAVLCFAWLAAVVICALDLRWGRDSENLRMFSAEIEYSDENVSLILDKFS